MEKIRFTGIALVVLVSLGLSACGADQSTPTPTPVDVQAIYTAAMQTAIAELTQNAPTATATATITPTPIPTNTPTITPTFVLSLETDIAIYMTNPIDQESCKYETLPIPVNHAITRDMVTDIRLALTYLFYTKWTSSGYLTNPLSTSSLQFSSIDITGNTMNVRLTGVISPYDDTCLNSEARDQVWATVGRYADPSLTIAIWVDTLLLDDVLIGR